MSIQDINQDQYIVDKYFNSDIGFGPHKQVAIDLLKECIDILKEFNIQHFLISGTLLGQVRHNDFIPWDDDIDIIVDSSIINKIDAITKKYEENCSFMKKDSLIKIFFNDKINILECSLNKYLLNNATNYYWPFIDLFIYEEIDNNIKFFEKKWDKNYFFPPKLVNFNNIQVCIPKDPHYFLKINYRSSDYMNILVSNSYKHKEEKSAGNVKSLSFNIYKSIINYDTNTDTNINNKSAIVHKMIIKRIRK
jgi:phosphorylcholine metabolism protein LicD